MTQGNPKSVRVLQWSPHLTAGEMRRRGGDIFELMV